MANLYDITFLKLYNTVCNVIYVKLDVYFRLPRVSIRNN